MIGGAGSDTFILDRWKALEIADFTAGAGGDVISLSKFISGATPASYTPYGDGFILVKSGDDVLIRRGTEIDGYETYAVLKSVDMDDLTAANLGGYRPVATVDGTDGIDTLDGFAMSDVIRGRHGDDIIRGLDGDDYLRGEEGNNAIEGGTGNDYLEAFNGNDTLLGGDGNDTIRGIGGSNRLDGGEGYDVLQINAYAVNLNLATGLAVRNHPVLGGTDTISGFEEYLASSYADTITGSDRADVIIGGGGKDTIDGGGGNDSITASGPIYGRDGNDILSAVVNPTVNDNTVYGGDGDDIIMGGGFNDALFGDAGSDSIDGGSWNDYINGGARWDTLIGGHGDDTLDGGADNDRMWGGVGNDLYYVDHIGDRVFEDLNEGVDTVRASISFALTANVENLQLITGAGDISGTGNGLSNAISGNLQNNALSGGLGNDSLYGWAGNDVLDGGDGHDRLSGGDGLDTLTGGTGNDQLGGGGGADDFVFGSTATNGHDHIVDFQHGLDRLVFTGADYGFASGHVLTTAEFTVGTIAVGSSAQFIWDGAGQHLWFDADGSGGAAAIELALISGAVTVTKDDLVFV